MSIISSYNNPSIGGFGNESGFIFSQHQQKTTTTTTTKENRIGKGNDGKSLLVVASASTSASASNTSNTNSTNSTHNPSKSSKDGGDAFAQILKELVDNAVDACSISSKASSGTCTIKSLKRVRVLIEKVDHFPNNVHPSDKSNLSNPTNTTTSSTTNDSNSNSPKETHHHQQHHNDNNNNNNDNDREHLLRITVSDNGCGMDDIEKCVSAFSSTKAILTTGTIVPNSTSGTTADAKTKGSTHKEYTSTIKSTSTSATTTASASASTIASTTPSAATPTAGRYGIGLTLCLLHAQRLVPNSCTSIKSSTSSQPTWTVAKFVVDTERDAVVCVEKKLVEKKKDTTHDIHGGQRQGQGHESGTSVSLLLPGGIDAKKAWPRLAEYFARFQLSLGLRCSLEVMAPSLSPCPLFIRPVCEKEVMHVRHQQVRQQKEQQKQQQKEKENQQQATSITTINDISQKKANDNDTNINNNLESDSNNVNTSYDKKDDVDDWIDNIDKHQNDNKSTSTIMEHSKQNQGTNNDIDKTNTARIIDEIEWIDNFDDEVNINDTVNVTKVRDKNDQIPLHHRKQRHGQRTPSLTSKLKEISDDSKKKQLLQSAASSYLQKPIPLENIAYSCQKIRIEGDNKMNTTRSSNISICPSLEVDMIVCENEEESHDGDNFSDGDNNNHNNDNDTPDESVDPKTAKIFLIRMVNQIPLLDGAEASACGIVQGIARKRSMWNSFGLDVAPLNQSAHPYNLKTSIDSSSLRNRENSSYLYIPTFSLDDSAQVAPYFTQGHTHSLFEDDIEDDESDDSSDDDCYMEEVRKRKRGQKVLLLPAGLRLGKILIIVQLQADPIELPLPTLSKGRLPMNDKGIDDALELGITSCLRSLQKSNPSLLLNASQLKKTERDVRFIPSIASALASMVVNCNSAVHQKEMRDVMKGWKTTSRDKHEKLSIVTPEDGYWQSGTRMEVNDSTSDRSRTSSELHVPSSHEVTISNQCVSQEDLTKSIALKFREVMTLIEERKIEDAKRAKMEYSRRKKKAAKCNDTSDDLSCSSAEDLDDFLFQEKYQEDENMADSDGSKSDLETNIEGGNVSKNDEDDFEGDEWW